MIKDISIVNTTSKLRKRVTDLKRAIESNEKRLKVCTYGKSGREVVVPDKSAKVSSVLFDERIPRRVVEGGLEVPLNDGDGREAKTFLFPEPQLVFNLFG